MGVDRPSHGDDEQSEATEAEPTSLIDRFVKLVETQGEVTGSVNVPYVYPDTRVPCRYSVTMEGHIMVMQLSIDSPLKAGETERIEVQRTGAMGSYTTHEPAEIGKRVIVVVYDALGYKAGVDY